MPSSLLGGEIADSVSLRVFRTESQCLFLPIKASQEDGKKAQYCRNVRIRKAKDL